MNHRKQLLLAVVLTATFASVQAQDVSKTDSTQTYMSVLDISNNYGINPNYLRDTLALGVHLKASPQNYPALAEECSRLSQKVDEFLKSLSAYTLVDSLLYIDSTHAINDYYVMLPQLQALSRNALNMSQQYTVMEQQRIAAEELRAKMRAEAEAKRIQQQKEDQAASLRTTIEQHHHAIASTCDGNDVLDKNKKKELKDIYYAYLTIYNRFDLSVQTVTDPYINRLNDLNDFQSHLIDSVLGAESYLNQIDNFKNALKLKCGKDHSEVFKSYSKQFKHVNIPVTFATMQEYWGYIAKLKDAITIQNRYMKSVDQRDTIRVNSTKINTLYSKTHRDIASAYKDVVNTLDQLPAFTTLDESSKFTKRLEEFIQVQQVYITNCERLNVIDRRSDTINLKAKRYSDVVQSYRELLLATDFVPTFKTLDGGRQYGLRLNNFEHLQDIYLYTLELRDTISANEEVILKTKNVDKILTTGYKLLKEEVTFRPNFTTDDKSEVYLASLKSFIDVQYLFRQAMANDDTIESLNQQVKLAAKTHVNIGKAYNKLYKAYRPQCAIISRAALKEHLAAQESTLNMERYVLRLIDSPDVNEYNERLKRINDIDKIKLTINLFDKGTSIE